MKRLNKKGETLVETLIALLIVSVCFLMLINGIITAANINKKTKEMNVNFNIKDAKSFPINVQIQHKDHTFDNIEVNGYQSESGHIYYEVKK